MDFVAKTYQDGSYAARNATFGDDTAAWKAENAVRMMALSGLKPARICEIGCGGGGILRRLRELLPETELTGYEPMPEAYAYAKERENERLKVKQSGIETIEPGAHDLALMFDVFEHVEDYIAFLRQASRVCRDFIFHIPLDMNAQMVAREKPIRLVRDAVGHLHYFSKYTAVATLDYSGFEVVNHFYTDGWTSGQRSFRNILARLPRMLAMAIAPDISVRVLGGFPLMVHARSRAFS
jgi:SAM-dependent methyltransferase